jgi:hypothetical protein
VVVFDQNTWDYVGSHPHAFSYDCAGTVNGDAVEDECGVCNGDGIADGECDCDGNVEDCAGECGGDATEDNCNICDNDATNELQVLSLSNDTLYLTNGNSVYIGNVGTGSGLGCSGSQIFSFTGTQQLFLIPSCANEILIECWGAEGQSPTSINISLAQDGIRNNCCVPVKLKI